MAAAQLDPVYLVNGDNEVRRRTVLDRLRARFEKMADLDFNSDTFDGTSAKASEIVASCNTLPFGSERRLVLVRSADRLSSTDQKELADYCLAPCETTVLVLVASHLAKTSALYKAIEKTYSKQSIIACETPRDRELPDFVASRAKAHGVSMRYDTAKLLVQLAGTSLGHLESELAKLVASLPDGRRTIEKSDVSRLVQRVTRPKPWELPDALSTRDAALALELSCASDATPLSRLFGCCRRVRDLISVQTLDRRGEGARIPATLGQSRMSDWQLRRLRSQAANFTPDELREALCSAARAERLMKSRSDDETVFQTWLLATCRGVDAHFS